MPRRASDTTLANVASRTSSSHSAVRASPRVEVARCVTSHAISSTVFDRSNSACSPAALQTSTAPSSFTTIAWSIGSKAFDSGSSAGDTSASAVVLSAIR